MVTSPSASGSSSSPVKNRTISTDTGDPDQTETTTTTDAEALETNHRKILNLIAPITNAAQHIVFSDKQNTKQGIEILNRTRAVRNKCHLKTFGKILFRLVCPVFQNDTKEEFTRNLMDYVYYTCTRLESEEDPEEIETLTKLRNIIFRCCTKYHSDSRIPVRENITNLCARLLDSLESVETLDEKLLEALESMYLHRIKDKSPHVRAYGAKGLKHFQLESDPSICEVSKSLIFHCKYDPNPEVRRMALKSMHIHKATIEAILEKVCDANDSLRVTALTIVAKHIQIEKIQIDDREKLLETGLEASSTKVRKAAEQVVEAWLGACNGDIIRFLSKLDVVAKRKPCYLALDYVYENGSNDAFKKVKIALWGSDKLIPMKRLSEEVAFYWKYIVARFRKIPVCAELIVPPTHEMCLYLRKYYEVYETRFSDRQGATVLEQLLGILYFASSVSEEGGRLEILDLIQTTLDFTYIDVIQVNVILDLIYSLVEPKKLDMVFFDFIESMLLESQNDPCLRNATVVRQNEPDAAIADAVDFDDSMAKKIEFGTLIHKKHKLIGEKADALLKNDYMMAERLQVEIDAVSVQAEALRPQRLSSVQDELSKSRASATSEEVESSTETEMETDPTGPQDPKQFLPAVLQFAFAAFLEHLIRQPKPSATAVTFYQTYIPSSIVCETQEVRILVLHCMGAMGLTNAEEAVKCMTICLQAIMYDHEAIAEAGFRSMFDLILHYGFDQFEETQIQTIAEGRKRRQSFSNSLLEESGPSLKIHILDQLNSNNQTMVRLAATGLMKLTLGKRMNSSKLITRLLTMWINPVYADSELYRDMTNWLPLYAKMGLDQGLLIADALVPALRKLVYAGRESPLADASPEKLAAFVAMSTASSTLEKFVENPVEIHKRMTHAVLTEMGDLGPCPELPVFGKTLKFFSLRGLSGQELEVLIKKVTKLLRLSGNKTVSQSLNAFLKHLNAEQLLVVDKSLSQTEEVKGQGPENENDSDEDSIHISDSSDDEDAAKTVIENVEDNKMDIDMTAIDSTISSS